MRINNNKSQEKIRSIKLRTTIELRR